MDRVDWKILELITENCRQNLKIVAKRVGVSRQTLQYRLTKFQREKVILKYTITTILNRKKNPNVLVLVKSRHPNRIIEKINRKHFVYEQYSTIGEFNSLLWVSGQVKLERGIEIHNFQTKIYSQTYPFKKLFQHKTFTSAPLKLDQKDHTILKLLKKDGRMAINAICETTGYAKDTVRKRIRKYIASGQVSFVAQINRKKLAIQTFFILVTGTQLTQVFEYIKAQQQTKFVGKTSKLVEAELWFTNKDDFLRYIFLLRKNYPKIRVIPLFAVEGKQKIDRNAPEILTV